MWIHVPSISSRSVQGLAGLNSGHDWRAFNLELFATWRGKSMPQRFWLRAFKRVPWMTPPFGRMCSPSMAAHGVAQWIASLPDSPASLSRLPESEKEKRTSVGSGQILRESFVKWDRAASFWRTCQASLLEDLDRYSETWPTQGTMRNGTCLVRPKSERRISASGYSSWPTPDQRDHHAQGANQKATSDRLGTLVEKKNWQTITTTDASGRDYTYPSGDKENPFLTLTGEAKNWPTPGVHTGPDASPNSQRECDLRESVKSWPTPRMTDYKGAGQPGDKAHKHRSERFYLDAIATGWDPSRQHLTTETDGPQSSQSDPSSPLRWKTPHGFANTDRHGKTGGGGSEMAKQAMGWGTPMSHERTHTPRDVDHGKQLANQVGRRLNPLFVEWLMGFPIGWTALEPVGMESYRLWQHSHSELFGSA